MEILENLHSIKNLSLALGYFDGVHKGHQKVIKSAVNYAKENNTKSAVITFKKNPLELFYDEDFKYIITKEFKHQKIEELGIDYLFELDFNNEMSKITGKNYLKDILIKYFSPISISTGFNHTFGANKSGNTDLLERMQKEFNYKYFKIDAEKLNDEIISSTAIKKSLINGDILKANSMLGYDYTISGEVIEGNKIGRTMGFPTANICYPTELVKPPYGAYSTNTKVESDNNTYNSITNFGKKPTVCNNCKEVVEVNIFNFDKNIYNRKITVSFLKKIRNEKKFSSIEELKQQIKEDISKC